MTILHLDYETRSVADLRAVGLYEYVAHPTTQVLCAAYAFDHDAPVVWDALAEPVPADLRDALTGGVTVSAWNAAFEREVTRRVLGLAVPDAVWSCSMARAAAMGLPLALERFVAVFCPDVPKDMAGNRQMQQCARPRRLTEDGTPVWWEDAARLARVRDYCAQDVRAEQAADRVLRPLSETERRIWHLDQAINARGMAVDRVTAEGAARVAAAVTAEAGATLATLTRGAVTAATQHGRVTDWLRAEGVDVVSVDKDGTAALLADPSLPETARAVLTVRQDVARTSTAKLDTMLAWTATDGRARGMFQYSAAHTGRWGGRGPQPQNFPRPELDEAAVDALLPYLAAGDAATLGLLYPPMLVVASSLRRMLTAAPGQWLVAGDYSAIEPRVLAWVAGQDDALARMRGGKMVEYEHMAASIYNIPVSAVQKFPHRQLGKGAVLGAGYGMGWKKFQATVAKAPYFVTVTDEMADRAIRAYRETYAEVPRFWYGVQDAAIRAVQEPRVPHDYRGIRFVADAAWLLCRLPSGRVLTYPRPDVRPHPTPWGEERPALFAWGENSVTRQWEEYSLYGGLLTENIVQAVARDLLADAMLRLASAGEHIVLHAHDEIVCETPDPARTLATMTTIMQSPPTWGRDIPVAVETWTDFRYRK